MEIEQLKNEVKSLTEVYGVQKVENAIQSVLGGFKTPPADYLKILSPEALVDSINQLNAATQDIIEKGAAKEKAYSNKGELLKQKRQLETRIELEEAEAIMEIRGEARSQYVMIGGEKVALTNDTARDAYRRTASKAARQELADVEADIAKLEVDNFKATDAWYTAKEASDKVQAKAQLQAVLLNFLK